MHSVKAFLDSVYPRMEAALLDNLRHNPYGSALDPDLLYSELFADFSGISRRRKAADPRLATLCVTSVSWNAKGYLLAASYGRLDVQGWSDDKGCLACWNTVGASTSAASSAAAKSEILSHEPSHFLETPSPLMCCAFYPGEERMGLICGGTFAGELIVWDLAEDDPTKKQRCKSEASSDHSHREPITGVSWITASAGLAMGKAGKKARSGTEPAFIVTVGGDSRVCVWRLDKMAHPLRVLDPAFSERLRSPCGISCMSVEPDEGQVLLGTEAGLAVRFQDQKMTYAILSDDNLMQAELQAAAGGAAGATAAGTSPLLPLTALSKLRRRGETKHDGPVHAVEFSPHVRNLYLTAGMDGSLRIVSALENREVVMVEPSSRCLYCASWSPHRPALVAAGAGDGRVYFFDLSRDPYQPVTVISMRAGMGEGAGSGAFGGGPTTADALPSSGAGSRIVSASLDGAAVGGGADYDTGSVNALAFNPTQKDLVACAMGGSVQIWTLGPGLTDRNPSELRMIAELSGRTG